MFMYDVIIQSGQIIDGTGSPRTQLDIGVVDGKIHKIGQLAGEEALQKIDATNLIVSPGFIDTHVHSDLYCTKPEIHYIRALQGVTTELLGQDGISVAPVSKETKPLWQKQLKGLNGDIGDWNWNSIEEYLSFLDQSKMVGNASYLVPHGGVRSLVMGFAGRKASKNEMIKMRELVEIGMEEGAIGVSSGLVYPPNVFSNKEELIEICKGAAKYDGCFVVHIRNESNHSLVALEEVIDVARQSGVRLHISHFKVAGLKNRLNYPKSLEKMERARNEGIEVTFDQYPYTAGSTVFHAILPPWMHEGGTSEMLTRLQDKEVRERIKQEFTENDSYENWVNTCGWDKIVITAVASEGNKKLEGLSVAEIANSQGRNPADVAFDLLLEEKASVTMIVHWGQEKDIISAMKHPFQMVGSDGIFGGKPHPRLYGTFPRILGKYVREQKVLTLEEAIHKMTGAPAQFLRYKDRGLIREGYAADLVLFDKDLVEDRATYQDPLQAPAGIHHVFVNGKLTISNQQYIGTTAGAVIRRGE
jgi:N-acyl-D-amino-acid deacylase